MFGFQKTHSDQDLIKQCLQGKASAQKALYERFAPRMMSVCFRYTGNEMDAEDVLVTAFVKIFEKLHQYSGEGNFEGWIRKVMVNESLMFLRKRDLLQHSSDIETADREMADATASDALEVNELMDILQELPDGYRTVFSLYAIEGYSHKEIATMLNISEGTSKSQLSKARAVLQELVTRRTQPKSLALIALLLLATAMLSS